MSSHTIGRTLAFRISSVAATLPLILGASVAYAEHPGEMAGMDHEAMGTGSNMHLEEQIKMLQSQVINLMTQLQSEGGAGHMMTTMASDMHAMMAACDIDTDLAEGASNDLVHCLQKTLKDQGFLHIDSTTGYFGPLTRAAVQAWQNREGLPATGYFGPLSRAAWKRLHAMNTGQMEHAHELYEVPAGLAAPSVALQITKDPSDGWNVMLATTNFVFAPEHANSAHVMGEGHAHLYIDGVKIGRLYGPWHHVPAAAASLLKLGHGTHMVAVELSTNDHKTYAVNGTPIRATANVGVK